MNFAFTAIPAALNAANLTAQAQALYLAIASHTRPDRPFCFPSQRRLLNLTGWKSPKTLLKYLDELESAGWIAKEQRRDEHGRFHGWLYNVFTAPSDQAGGSPKPLQDTPQEPKFTARYFLSQEEDQAFLPEEEHTLIPPARVFPAVDYQTPLKCPLATPTIEKGDLSAVKVSQAKEAPLQTPKTASSSVSSDELVITAPAEDTAAPQKTVFLVRRTSAQATTKPSAIPAATLEAIERQVTEGTSAGTIRNPAAYRRVLLSLAARGEYQPPAKPSEVVALDQTKERLKQLDQERAQAAKDDCSDLFEQARHDPRLRRLFVDCPGT